LVRARLVAVQSVRRARQQLSGFLLRHGCIYNGKTAWTRMHRRWLAGLRFAHPAQQVVAQDYIAAVSDAERRREALNEHIRLVLPAWSMAPVVNALQALRGVALIVAATLVAEIGDLTRFENPGQLMARLAPVPSEHSSGTTIRLRRRTLRPRPRQTLGFFERSGQVDQRLGRAVEPIGRVRGGFCRRLGASLPESGGQIGFSFSAAWLN
jgi:transposase